MKKLLSLILALMLLCTMFAGCVNQNQDTSSKDTLTAALSSPPGTLDPIGQVQVTAIQVLRPIFSTLVAVDSNNQLKGDLATKWTISEDRLTYTFELRNDVKFHDGTALTVEDIIFSIEANKASPNTMSYYVNVASVEKTNDTTLTIKLNQPDGSLLYTLASVFVVPAAKYQEQGGTTFAENLIGSGPFKVESINATEETYILTRNDAYYGEASKLKTITLRTYVSSDTALIALENGELDWIRPNASGIKILKGNDNFKLEYSADTSQVFLCFNSNDENFKNPKLREAIAYALNYDMIRKTLGEGETVDNNSFNMSAWDLDIKTAGKLEYNPEKAKQILQDAGISTPLDLGSMLSLPGNYANISQIIQSNLKDIGITISVESVDPSTWGMSLMTGKTGMTVVAYVGGMDPAADLAMKFRTGSSGNYAKYSNAQVDELLNKINTATGAEQMGYLEELFTIIETECPCVNLYDICITTAYHKNLITDGVMNLYINFANFAWAE